MPKIIQISATSCTNMVGDQWPRLFALTDGGHVLRLSDSQGWVLMAEPEWEMLGVVDDDQSVLESPWVKVSDQLPEGDPDRQVFVRWCDGSAGSLYLRSVRIDVNNGQMTHWMEIPEVPYESDKEK